MCSHVVRKFDVETKNANGDGEQVYKGNVIGEGLRIKLSGEEIYGVKLRINESRYRTQITAFNVYE